MGTTSVMPNPNPNGCEFGWVCTEEHFTPTAIGCNRAQLTGPMEKRPRLSGPPRPRPEESLPQELVTAIAVVTVASVDCNSRGWLCIVSKLSATCRSLRSDMRDVVLPHCDRLGNLAVEFNRQAKFRMDDKTQPQPLSEHMNKAIYRDTDEGFVWSDIAKLVRMVVSLKPSLAFQKPPI